VHAGPAVECIPIAEKRSNAMVARILESKLKQGKKAEYMKAVQHEILPLLREQAGFLEILSFFPEHTKEDRVFSISLWAMKADAEYSEHELNSKVDEVLNPYLDAPAKVSPYTVEGSLFQFFADTLAA
jgi:heme-degrading monooxygenase HmoA